MGNVTYHTPKYTGIVSKCRQATNGTGHFWRQVHGEVWRCKNCGYWVMFPVSFEFFTRYGYNAKKNGHDNYCKVSRNMTADMREIMEGVEHD
jgi:hypothetical protein